MESALRVKGRLSRVVSPFSRFLSPTFSPQVFVALLVPFPFCGVYGWIEDPPEATAEGDRSGGGVTGT